MRKQPSGLSIFAWSTGAGVALAALLTPLALGPLALAHGAGDWISAFYGTMAVNHVARANAPAALPSASPRNLLPGRERRLPNVGLYAYTGSCAECHGSRGDGQGTLGSATEPAATDLTGPETRNKSDAELFWIIKNGLSFTAMPGYGDVYSDYDLAALVQYVRTLQQGQGRPIDIPAPTPDQLAAADPGSTDVTRRGAAVYFAQRCNLCHGPTGNAPGDLRIEELEDAERVIRGGRPGMPAFGPEQISDAQLGDLLAYLHNLPNNDTEE
jgi:mono/diheme cytochrome c family protein